ncbi:chemotaxis protein CheW [Thioalkalivibrio sp.]|uniref:chemotaxis protein CheW n=1 Tax=Thioalkalivibrio sp. TaxID=2093813 RepID=UPI0039748E98
MSDDMSQFHQVFFEEAAEHLAEMEGLLLKLDVARPDLEMLNAIFRAAHSIKGGAGTFGFQDMAGVTHELETLLDRLRREELRPTVAMVDTFLDASDVLTRQLEGHREGVAFADAQIAEVCSRLEALAGAAADGAPATPPLRYWRVAFDPAQADCADAGQRDALAASLEELGTLERVREDAGEGVLWRLCSAGADREAILNLFAFLCDPERIEVSVEAAADSGVPAPAAGAGEAGGAEAEDPGFGFFVDAPGTEGLQEAGHAAPAEATGYGFFEPSPGSPGQRATPPEAPAERTSAPKRTGAAESSIRVSVEKVDQLINLVGELVITHAMLAESGAGLDPVQHERILGGLSNLERNSRDLQQAVMSIRMMPISFVFNRFPRLVRDTAAAMHKQVRLTLVGEDTELDKGLIERLADPLNHLVRNSIDHGIERPEQRRAAGKLETGEITLRASHQGGSVVIEVSDDGAGLDRERLLAKAAQRGLALPENPSDREVWSLIFAAGFSTAEQVTDISGRGVGMDVVRRNIEAMNGRVEIDSAPGQGTRILIRLPLTLAILDGMSVRLGTELYILPVTAIRESIQPRPEQFKHVAGKGRVLQVGSEYLPLIVLRDVFGLGRGSPESDQGIVVIVDTGDGRAALRVDELVAQHQVVIKSLETNYRKVDGVSGATIMGDGRVALILDVDELLRLNQAASAPPRTVSAVGVSA